MVDPERDSFRQNGWLVQRDAIAPDVVSALVRAVDDLGAGARTPAGLHHYELTDAGPVPARSEDFVHASAPLRDFIDGEVVMDVLARLFGEPAVLFKEKINYKHPGGAGFAPHQDAAAYRFVEHHISCMVPLDPATEASGCLWVAPGYERGLLPTDERGCLTAPTVEALDWCPVLLAPGDLLFFDSYTPHFSQTNRTARARRALYLTYNAASRGDHRDRYYADKLAEFDRTPADADRLRLSITGDFLGRPVTPGV